VPTDAIDETPVRVTLAALAALTLAVTALAAQGVISDRAALGALAGLVCGALTLAAAWVLVHTRVGGATRE
jgi:hypothetical protein